MKHYDKCNTFCSGHAVSRLGQTSKPTIEQRAKVSNDTHVEQPEVSKPDRHGEHR